MSCISLILLIKIRLVGTRWVFIDGGVLLCIEAGITHMVMGRTSKGKHAAGSYHKRVPAHQKKSYVQSHIY